MSTAAYLVMVFLVAGFWWWLVSVRGGGGRAFGFWFWVLFGCLGPFHSEELRSTSLGQVFVYFPLSLSRPHSLYIALTSASLICPVVVFK